MAGEAERGILICGSGVGASRGGQQDARHPRGGLPRHLLRAPGRRARRHERPDARRPGHRTRARLRVRRCAFLARRSAASRAIGAASTRCSRSRPRRPATQLGPHADRGRCRRATRPRMTLDMRMTRARHCAAGRPKVLGLSAGYRSGRPGVEGDIDEGAGSVAAPTHVSRRPSPFALLVTVTIGIVVTIGLPAVARADPPAGWAGPFLEALPNEGEPTDPFDAKYWFVTSGPCPTPRST